jgi:hypothetical protein
MYSSSNFTLNLISIYYIFIFFQDKKEFILNGKATSSYSRKIKTKH